MTILSVIISLHTRNYTGQHTAASQSRGTRTYIIELGVVEVDVIDEDEAVAGDETTVDGGDAAGHQTADDDHRLVGVDRVLATTTTKTRRYVGDARHKRLGFYMY